MGSSDLPDDPVLKQHLTTWMLIVLGISSTVGSGIFMVIGIAAKEYAGPSVIISFVIAGLLAVSNSLAYGDLSSTYAGAGGIYTYVLRCWGEKWAFVIGWLSILGNTAAVSIGAQTFSSYSTSIFLKVSIYNQSQYNTSGEADAVTVSDVIDFPAGVLVLISTLVLLLGTFTATKLTSVTCLVSITALIVLSVTGFMHGSFQNLTDADHPHFAPNGFTGILQGAAVCYFAYTGFVTICFSSEEAKNANRSVPRAISIVVVFVLILYLGVTVGVLMVEPYWLLDTRAPLLAATQYVKSTWITYVLILGISTGLVQVTLSSIYGLSRLVFSMARDGLLFVFLQRVSSSNGTPISSLQCCGILCALSASVLNCHMLLSFTTIVIFVNSIVANILVVQNHIHQYAPFTTQSQNSEVTIGKNGTMYDLPRDTLDTQTSKSDYNMELMHTSLSVNMDTNKEEPVVITDVTDKCNAQCSGFSPSSRPSEESLIYNTNLSDINPINEWQVIFAFCTILVSAVFLSMSVLLLLSSQTELTFLQLASPLCCVSTVLYGTVILFKMVSRYSSTAMSMPCIPFLPIVNILLNVMMLLILGDSRGSVYYVILAVIGVTMYKLVGNPKTQMTSCFSRNEM